MARMSKGWGPKIDAEGFEWGVKVVIEVEETRERGKERCRKGTVAAGKKHGSKH